MKKECYLSTKQDVSAWWVDVLCDYSRRVLKLFFKQMAWIGCIFRVIRDFP